MEEELDLQRFCVQEVEPGQIKKIDGGFIQFVPIAVAMGAVCGWVFEKGEELGTALAKNH